jgi:general secretion pathway protein D
MRSRPLQRLFLACALAALAGCAAQQLNRDGMRLIESGQREQGLALLARAAELEPTNSRLRMDYLKQQALAVRELLARADEARAAGQGESARELYRATLRVDPGNDRARRGLAAVDMDDRHRALVAEAEALMQSGDLAGARSKLRQVLLENPAHAAAQRQLALVNERVERAEEAARQQLAAASVLKKPVTLQFRDASVRMVFEALSRTTGLNVIFDRDVRADLRTTIFVRDASVGDTVDLILLQNQLEKKVLNANTLFIYPATSAKHKEYQDLKVRTFQVSNADAKHLQNVLKTVLKIKDVVLDERTNTLVIRDSADAVAVAEKVIAAHDLPDPEVMLEVEVLEVSRDRLSNLGVQWPDGATVATPKEAATIGALRALSRNELTITPLAIGVNLKLQDTDANLLASPRIRARHKEKARILIGDKVPVITNSVTPVQTGTAVITGTVQYLDVGIKLEVEPHVYAEGDVGIKLNLEVSNIVKEIPNEASGSLAYQIGTRSAQTNLRLRDGETQILGGLISDQDRNTAGKVPGLGQLPILGRLFSNHNATVTKSEIILSITPRIIRSAATADASLRDVYSGTEATMRQAPLRLDPIGAAGGAAPAAVPAAAPRAVRPPAERPAEALPGAPAADPGPEGKPAADEEPAAPAPRTQLEPAPAAGRGAPAELAFNAPATVRVGEPFEVTLDATLHEPLPALPLVIRFDPHVLSFVDLQLEALARGVAVPTPKVDAQIGRIDIELQAAPGKPLAGQGPLLRLRFTATSARAQTRIALGQITLPGADGVRTIPRPRTLLVRVTP